MENMSYISEHYFPHFTLLEVLRDFLRCDGHFLAS